MEFKARNADPELKEKAVERIEHAMKNHCKNCAADTADNTSDMCQKHLKMYGKIYP